MNWDILLGWVLGAVSSVAGFFAGQATDWFARRRDRMNTAQAIAAEIQALLDVVERRQYLQHLEAIIGQMEATQVGQVFWFAVTSNPFRVYENNLAKIGMLAHPLPAMVVRFYAQATAFLADVRMAEQVAQQGVESIPVADLHRGHVQARELLVDTIALGKEIVAQVKR